MKKILIFVLAVAFSMTAGVVKAQEKAKEGKAVFEISYPDAENMNDQQLAMMPKDVTIYFKEGKSRSEVKMGYGSVITISDDKGSISLSDIMGKKTAIKTTKEDAEKAKKEGGDYDVKITDETKTIAGYKCKKAVVTMKKDNNTIDVWFTNELEASNSSRNAWKGIDGFMMEFTMAQQGMTMKMTCTSVDKKATVSDDMFKIPEGYTVMTQEEMKKQYQGGH